VKITYIANACCLYEHEGYKILSDPWLADGAFEGSWAHFPPLLSKAEDFFDVDLIYISHLHPDHYDEETLKKFPKTIPILILDSKPNYLLKKVESLKFKTIHQIPDQGILIAGPFKITMFAPFTGHLFYETEIGNIIDSAIVLEAGGIKIFNANDNAPTLEASRKLQKQFGSFDLIQLVDSTAGPYPACFKNLTHEEKLSERDRILTRHMDLMCECAKVLNAKLAMPFAGHYKLRGPLEKLNQYLGVYEPEEVKRVYESKGIPSICLRERESYEIFV
jgi:UDP-MurNAc hydroxylase